MTPRIFLEPEAQHFCSEYQSSGGDALLTPEEFQKTKLGYRKKLFAEGSFIFNNYRDSILREAERLLFLSASQYRRAHDLLIVSSVHWAHVTMYYGTWYTAKALLAMFGCFVTDKVVVDVEKGDV